MKSTKALYSQFRLDLLNLKSFTTIPIHSHVLSFTCSSRGSLGTETKISLIHVHRIRAINCWIPEYMYVCQVRFVYRIPLYTHNARGRHARHLIAECIIINNY